MKRIALIAAFLMAASGTAYAEVPEWDVSDRYAPVSPQEAARSIAGAVEGIGNAAQAEIWTDEQSYDVPESYGETISDVYTGFDEYEPYYEPQGAYMPSDGLTADGGVNYYGGRMETYYSSNVAQHYRIGEWTADDEGFWRTDEGYYVVAASDMEQGTVFEGSKGECIVLDSGCADGTTDYYVAW